MMPGNSALSFVRIRSELSSARTDLMAMKRGSTLEEYGEIEQAIHDVEHAMAMIDRIQTRRGGNRDGLQKRGLRGADDGMAHDPGGRRQGAQEHIHGERPPPAGLQGIEEAGGGRHGGVRAGARRERLLEEGAMATVPRTRLAVLRDLADAGPMAASVLKDRHGPYAYPCAYKMVADGLVAVDKRTKAFVITDEGRAFLKTWESSE